MKVASAALIHSCATLEGTITPHNTDANHGVDAFISDEINVYSARLAVCELKAADSSLIPYGCSAFVPTTQSTKKSTFSGFFTGRGATKPTMQYPHYEDITQSQLKGCLEGLAQDARTWNSFSNQKQTAVAMCHAMRGEVERDETIHLYKVLRDVEADVVDALFQSKEEWEAVKSGISELGPLLRQMHVGLVTDDEQRRARATALWTEWEAAMKADLQDLSTAVTDIKATAAEANADLTTNNDRMRSAFLEAQDNIQALSLHQDQAMIAAQDGVIAFNDIVAYTLELMNQTLIQDIYKASSSLQLTNLVVSNMSSELVTLRQELEKLQQAADDADRISTSIASLHDLLMGDWAGALRNLGSVCAYGTIFSLLSIGVWFKSMGLVGSICAALATGFAGGWVMTFYSYDIVAGMSVYLPPPAAMATLLLHAVIVSSLMVGFVSLLSVLCRVFAGRWAPWHAAPPSELPPYSGQELPTTEEPRGHFPFNDPKWMAEKRARMEMTGRSTV